MRYVMFILMSLAILMSAIGCDKNATAPEHQEEVAIFGFLWADQPLDSTKAILITRTEPITDFYEIEKAALTDTRVTIVDEARNITYTLSSSAHRPGYFYNPELVPESGKSYQLRVEWRDKIISARTKVPAKVTLVSELSRDQINIEQADDLGYRKPVRVYCDDPNQVILVDLFCDEPLENAEYINPFGGKAKPEEQEEYDQGRNAEPRHIKVTALYKDLVTDDYPGEHVVYWYASMLVFYGSNTLQIVGIDDNYQHYMTDEHPVLSGGIQEGIGVFGSVSGGSYALQIVK